MSENKNMENSSKSEEKEISLDEINAQNNKILSRMLFGFWIMLIFLWIWNTKWEPILPIFDINPADLWDSINIFNALIGAITVAFVYGAYNLQQEAFVLQKKELKETRKTLENQEKEMQEQNRQQYIKFLLEEKGRIRQSIKIDEVTRKNWGPEEVREYYWERAMIFMMKCEEEYGYEEWKKFLNGYKYFLKEYYTISMILDYQIAQIQQDDLSFIAISDLDTDFFEMLRKYEII